MKNAVQTWVEACNILKRNAKIVMPFCIIAIVNLIALYILYRAPQAPVAKILAPPIRVFFGERFLHYPFNFSLLPKLFYYGRIAIGATIGVVMSAFSIRLVAGAIKNKKISAPGELFISLKRYFGLFGVWLVMFIPAFIFVRTTRGMQFAGGAGILLPYIKYAVLVLLQMLFVYSIPALIIEQRSVVSALVRNFSFLIKHFFTTLAIVMVPALLYVPILLLQGAMPGFISRFAPEIIIYFLAAGMIVSVLVDMFVTIASTIFFLKKKEMR